MVLRGDIDVLLCCFITAVDGGGGAWVLPGTFYVATYLQLRADIVWTPLLRIATRVVSLRVLN